LGNLKNFAVNITPTYLKKHILLLRIFYFLWDFSEQNGFSVGLEPMENQTEEEFLLIVHRFGNFKHKFTKLLDEFYEEVERFKRTGEFEIIWDEFISDSNDQ
jgi:hypothetical protein